MIALARFFGLRGGGSDKSPDAVNWDDVGPGDSPQIGNSQTIAGITGPITIRATLTGGAYGAGAALFAINKNSVDADSIAPANDASVSASVSNGDVIYFRATKGLPGSGSSWSATATVTVVETGQVLDTFTVSVSAIP
jgi:hypothetical protein